MDPKVTGKFISLLRKEKNMTQKELAAKLNVSDKAVSRWETGRGYPDIESLQALSCEFSITINELLCGSRIEAAAAQDAEKEIAQAYIDTSAEKRRIRLIAAILAAVLTFVTVIFAFTIAVVYIDAMGSPSCVIAKDYSYLILFGERYVPLVLEDAECTLSTRLIGEAQVEGTPFIGKLFFGDSVYAVKQCANNDIVYLETEYDYTPSNYYCIESKAKEYIRISQEVAYDLLSAEIFTRDWDTYDLVLSDGLAQMLKSANYETCPEVNCSWSRGKGDESIAIYSF